MRMLLKPELLSSKVYWADIKLFQADLEILRENMKGAELVVEDLKKTEEELIDRMTIAVGSVEAFWKGAGWIGKS